MYDFSTPQNDIYQQGVDEGRRQVLADMAKLFKDNEYPEYMEDALHDYLEQEGYL